MRFERETLDKKVLLLLLKMEISGIPMSSTFAVALSCEKCHFDFTGPVKRRYVSLMQA